MPTYYKLNFEGTFNDHNIINSLYFAQDDGAGFAAYDDDIALDILGAAGETFVEDYTAPLPTGYRLVLLRVSSVTERGAPNSPYDQIALVDEPGIQSNETVGAMQCAILSFTTRTAVDAARNMKRSYLAYGPVRNAYINADQTLTAAFLAIVSPLMLAIEAPLVGTLGEYLPVRVARTVAPAPIGVGTVRSIGLDPRSSTRKSRKTKPR